MNTDIIFNDTIFKLYRYTIYYINNKGDVYSSYCKRLIKLLSRKHNSKNKKYYYIDIFDRNKHKQVHVDVHKLVYITWVRELLPNEQVNHINDISTDNRVENLYVGTLKENIYDCFNNGHRVGNIKLLLIHDKKYNKNMLFCPAYNFIEYCGHTSKNNGIKKFFNKKWFQSRYEVLEYKNIKDLSEYQSVTTMGDECSPVGLSLSQFEAHCNINNVEEIV